MRSSNRVIIQRAAFGVLLGCTAAAKANLSFNVDASTFGTDTARYNAAVAAMQAVVNRYNVYGDFGNYNIYAYYNSGIPTAQSDYLGSIGFGGTYPNERVAQHESNHYLGSGTYGNWYNLFNSAGIWTGPRMNQLIQQFDGDGSVIRQAGVHFYNYGLNYDSEVTDNSILMRNIALMYAMRADMGNGNTANPWSATSVTLTASDTAGTSAFNWFGGGYSGSYAGWSDKYFAHAGAAYSTGAYDIRTPNGYPSWTFAGDSLTINTGGRLLFNGYGTAGLVTIRNLTVDGGTIRHDQFSQDLFQLAGTIAVPTTATIEAANGNINILSTISGAGTITKTGGYGLTLTGLNTNTGNLVVNAGTLAAGTGVAGTPAPQIASNLGDLAASNRTIAVNSGGTLSLTGGNVLGTGGSTNTLSGLGIVVNSGGVFQTGLAGSGSGWWNKVGNLTLNGGTVRVGTGGNNSNFQGLALIGSVAVAGSSASIIDTLSGSDNTANGIHLGQNATIGQSITFNVADATGDARADLTVNSKLINTSATLTASGLTKTGAGTMLLNGANAYTGATNINAGTLGFATSTSNIGPVNVASGASLSIGKTTAGGVSLNATSLSAAAGSTLAFDFGGVDTTALLASTGTLTLGGAVNVAIANGGALTTGSHPLMSYTSITGGGSLSGSPFTLGPRSTGTLVNNGTSLLSLSVIADRPIWTGADSGAWAAGLNGVNKNWKLQTAGSTTDYLQGDNVLLDDSATGATAVTINSGNVTPAAVTFNNSSKSYTVTSTGGYGIAGTGPLTKNGTGTLTLSTANTFTGPVTINGGLLYANVAGNPSDNAAFSQVSSITVNSGATLKAGANGLFGYSGNNEHPITVNGGTLTTDSQGDLGVGLVTLNGGTITTGGANATAGTWRFQDATSRLVVTDNATVSGVNYKFQNGAGIDVTSGKTLTFSGTITDTTSFGTSAIVKTGNGTMLLSGANAFSGGTAVSGGTVVISANNNLGADTSALTLNGGTLQTTNTGAMTFTHALTVGLAGGTINVVGNGAGTTGQGDRLVFNNAGAFLGSGNLTVNGDGTLAGVAPNTTTAGTGVLVFNAANTYSGTVTLQNGGLIEDANSTGIGTGSVVLGNEGEFTVTNGSTAANNITVNGGTNSVVSFTNAAGTESGTIQLNANLTVGLRNWYSYVGVQSGTLSGAINGGGSLIVNSGAGTGGTLTLAGNNAFTGNITVGNATLAAGTYNNGNAGTDPSNLGDLGANGRTITLNSGGTLSLTSGNVLGTGGSPSTLSGLTLVVNSGGAFQTGLNGTGSGWWNKIGAINLNGGTVHVGTGANNTSFQGLALIGTVTVGGTSASTIDAYAASDSTANGVHLGQNGTTGQSIVFNVADATGNANPDLTVSTKLLNTSANLVASGLTKTGVGTLRLTGANTYTGPTVIKAGTLTTTPGAYSNFLTNAGGVDLQGGRTVLDYTSTTSPVAQVKSLLTSAYASNFASGQIRSSTLTGSQTIGYSDDGTSAVTMRVTLPGDANLDGVVNFSDFLLLQANFGGTGTTFGQGNFNYDGQTDFSDFLILQSNFGSSINGTAAAVTASEVEAMNAFASASSVPEPSCLGFLTIGSVIVLKRRRSNPCAA